jgi:putative spermidine/putrescine transport system permease protein
VGGASQLFANVIYDNVITANNLPCAAPAAPLPGVTIIQYHFAVRRTGALDNL